MKDVVKTLIVALAIFVAEGATVMADGIAWPKDHVICEGSKSPNRRYAVLVPSRELGKDDGYIGTNYLVDVRAHRVLGKILNCSHIDGWSRGDMRVLWAVNSTWCVLQQTARIGVVYAITAIDLGDERLRQFDISQRVLDAGVGPAVAFYRLGPGRKFRVRALATDNVKRMEGRDSKFSLFQGTFELDAGKWTVANDRSVSERSFDALDDAYRELRDTNTAWGDEEGRADALDEQMNNVYAAVKLILPGDRFATVKREQVSWLKIRDKAHTTAQKCKLLKQRIRALQDLLW